MEPDHWIKKLSYVFDLTGLKNALEVSGRGPNDVVAHRLNRVLRFVQTTRFSMLDQPWDVVDFLNLRGEYAQPVLASADLVVRLEQSVGSNDPRWNKEQTDWGWEFMTFLRKPLAYSTIVYKQSFRSPSEPQRVETARVTYALEAFDAFWKTATEPCWPMLHVEEMEFGFTFMNEQDAVAFEALRLAFPTEFPPA